MRQSRGLKASESCIILLSSCIFLGDKPYLPRPKEVDDLGPQEAQACPSLIQRPASGRLTGYRSIG